MTLELITRSYAPTLRNDRASQELRAYVRSEWRGDGSWLRREPPQASLRSRLRGWLAARRPAVPVSRPIADAPSPEPMPTPAVPATLLESCPHPTPEELGASGTVVFLQCNACGDVLVVDQDREWSFTAVPPESPVELLRA